MKNLIKICENINQNSRRIIDNLNPESIEVYRFIQNEFKKGDVTKNCIFQFAYRSFYKLDSAGLTTEFKKKYFKLFEENVKKENPDLRETLSELSKIKNFKNQNTVQFSFVTKMFHTIDNNKPIYDNEVITVFGFKQPYHIAEKSRRIEKYILQYQEICKSYKIIEDERLLTSPIEEFKIKFSSHQINNIMIIDFLFWSTGKLIREKEISIPSSREVPTSLSLLKRK